MTAKSRKESVPNNRAHLNRVRGWQRHLSSGFLKAMVIADPKSPHFDRIVQAVDIVNTVQSYYRLRLRLDGKKDILRSVNDSVAPNAIRARIEKRFPNQLVIAMVDRDFDDGRHLVTINEAPGCTIISCDDWKNHNDAPSTRVYLVFQLISALITFAGCLAPSENENLMHGVNRPSEGATAPTKDSVNGLRGCLFDYWVGGKLLYLVMVSARLCPQCRAALLAHGTPVEAVVATESLLDWVRSVVINRESLLPRRIFIGHGRKDDWKVLRQMLRKWKIEVEEFNEQPVAGVSVTERLKSMLAHSRFAFLVMTAEDKFDKKHMRARMNVIHEIGLFQGRLGNERAVVLRERSAEPFTNLDGITRLDYDPGRIADLKPEIYRLLLGRGIISAEIKE